MGVSSTCWMKRRKTLTGKDTTPLILDMEQVLNYLIENGKGWIANQREINYPISLPLSQQEKEQLQPHFSLDTLDSVRVRTVSQINNPDFYSVFEQAGQQIPLDFRQMAGITFIDTILLVESKIPASGWVSLLFHECVHVCQYKMLGVEKFVEQYVKGWAQNGFEYLNIPLEHDAYALQSQFDLSPSTPINVEELTENKWKY